MSERKYTIDELKLLNDKVCWCFYSWCQHEILVCNILSSNRTSVFIEKFVMDYYLNNFFHEIFELYKYFRKHKDLTVLGKFVTTGEEYLKLRKVRNKIAHVDGGVQDTLEKTKEFIRATKRDSQIFDLIVIIKHTRVLLRREGMEHFLINRLKTILKLYPPNFIKESVLNDMLN